MESLIKSYDYLVIGAGSGALGSARKAANYGKKVAMIENKVIGGTCVNIGCVPKKVMYNLANFIEEAHIMNKMYAVQGVEHLKVDFTTFKQYRDSYVKRLNAIYHTNVEKAQIDYIQGTASFLEDKVIQVQPSGQKYTAEHILIASGSAPFKPYFEGVEHCMVSDDVFSLEQLPQSMIVIGGGYIGVEMSQIMHALGVKVTLVARDRVLRQIDYEVIDVLLDNIKKSGMQTRLNSDHLKVEKAADGMLTLTLKSGETMRAEKILLAIGRLPNLEPLGLNNTKIKVERGSVWVDEYQNTSVPGVYAIGDVIGHSMLTPVAIRAGRMLSQRLFDFGDSSKLKMTYKNIPTVIFSHPPIGSVGYSEEEANQKFGKENVHVYKSKFTNMFYSLSTDDQLRQGSLFKLICHKESDASGHILEKVVGIHAIGRGIDEMMQGLSIPIIMGGTKQDFDNVVAIHPTASEEFALMDPKFIM